MMRFWKSAALVIGSLLVSQSSYALVSGELLYGQRSAKLTGNGADESNKANELKLGVHLDPIPLVPIAFGVGFDNVTFKDKDGFKNFIGSEIDLEIMAWVPLDLFGLTPYARLGYTVAGGYKNDTESTSGSKTTTKYDVKGNNIGIGLKWSPLPLLAVELEGDMGNRKLKVSSGSVHPEFNFKSTSFMLGVEVGI